MNKLLKKEMRLSASVLSYLFIAFALMTLLPGYPILCGAFFVSFGIFQSFQSAREANDIVYSVLLPVAKRDVVKGKFCFSIFIELCGFLVMAILTVIRMTLLSELTVYRNNALMTANPFFLGMVLVIFGLFNRVFICGFFKTGYKFGPSFIAYIIAAFITLGIAESLHHIPGLEVLNSFGADNLGLQMLLFCAGIAVYLLLTRRAISLSMKRFEKLDL